MKNRNVLYPLNIAISIFIIFSLLFVPSSTAVIKPEEESSPKQKKSREFRKPILRI